MPKVRLFQGKPLIIGRKVAIADNCCCQASNTGACCAGRPDGSCTHVTEQECTDSGGTYLGDGTHCSPIPSDCCPLVKLTFDASGTIDLSGGCDGGGCFLTFDAHLNVNLGAMSQGCVLATSGSVISGGFNSCFGTPPANCSVPATDCGYTWDYSLTTDWLALTWTISATLTINCGDCSLSIPVSGSGSANSHLGNPSDPISSFTDFCDQTVEADVSITFL